ncbi:BglII/BstYI family type II restriction endonuclease [Brevibacillus brevis]|uniref:BglII/BstYI family type II restriction endonuclease n=1 Tax=Brevibacillus brevis TaxID=1393 RepID=UPI0025A56BAD|nr:BglII/BstYI family type II restriction endonuclease [Brevibacillus brevis]WJQ81015.1 BglII/BstYI family type II restriction endonuclease [Brevibacillus brevis]
MAYSHLPVDLREKFEVYEKNHAIAILMTDFPKEYEEIINILREFELTKDDILKPGGRKSPIAEKLDGQFYQLGWLEKQFRIDISVDSEDHHTPSHKVDCYKNRVGIEIEWNNKDPFYDRDLSNFRLLHDLNAISVGVIITRSDDLQEIFNELGKGSSYGASTTHFGKLKPRIDGRGGGGCPILVFAIKKECYVG